ncbi:GDP-mannose 4,6-dehydratase [Candidatus Parcubacteria bacterium]|nr:GDP-mannose 4,6-dehydratase [Candidatus Parcubacteria bacterium]
MNRILITGGAGFIGFHLTEQLLKNPQNELVLVDNLFRPGGKDSELNTILSNPRVTFMQMDLTDPSSFNKLQGEFDHVYHLASINGTRLFYEMPHEVLRVNTLTLIYLLDWFVKHNRNGKILLTSSNEAYAGALEAFHNLPLPTPETVPLVIADPYNPRWTYGGAKIINELFLIHYARKFKFRAVIVRPHNFYGPRDAKDHVVPDFFARIVEKRDPFPIFGADNTRDFCYVTDAVRAMQMLMDSPKTDMDPIETVHIGASNEISIENLARTMFDVVKWNPKTVETYQAPPGSVKRRLADTTKIHSLIDWKSEVSLEEGLKKTYDWFTGHKGEHKVVETAPLLQWSKPRP